MKFPKLLPQTDQFNRLLGELSAQTLTSAKNLKFFIQAKEERGRAEAAEAIAAARARSKALSADITRELCRSFITPFDREDIHDLTEHLYNIPKKIEKIKQRILLHNLYSDQSGFAPQIDIILEEAQVMDHVMRMLLRGDYSSKTLDQVGILRDLEHKGDDVRNQLLTALFSQEQDIRVLLLKRDIHDMLEKVVDRFRDAANVAFQIILKHN